ncbi:hypothetical protein EAH89_05065 [Roseomonas nepalensis]|uniref:VanZ family protein n=1 Tax=Muricoccus nepalensis TaxID=1854500 RepID=A0A502GCE3_9PROT|nr:hypothetical protein [Roseomonas nepalensis]TPG59615.1 hypothetical protein EAH89_05065 [Roseomonas nepalensis]
MPLLTRDDLRRQSVTAWACLLLLLAISAWFWSLDKRNASMGVLVSVVGCLGLILPPRERMAVLPERLRALPRALDAAPLLASLLSSPGYGLNWFYGENPYDEVVHLVSGGLAGAVFVGLLLADGRARTPRRILLAGAGFGLALGCAWEVFEAITGLIGDFTDTWTDILLTTLGAVVAAALAARRRGPRA